MNASSHLRKHGSVDVLIETAHVRAEIAAAATSADGAALHHVGTIVVT